MSRLLVGILGALLLQFDATQREQLIQEVSVQLSEGYLYAPVGQRLSELLKTTLARGDFDSIRDPSEMARSLTQLLQRETKDLHLRVSYRNPSAPPNTSDRQPVRRRPGNSKMIGRVEMLQNSIGYLEVLNFAGTDIAEIDAAMAVVKSAKALIIDVGQNPGGAPMPIQYLSTYLFSERTHLVNTFARGMSGPAERWTLDKVPGQRMPKVPVYVLTSRRTFSAGESFAFGLRVTGRAIIIGERTGGGGHSGRLVSLSNGFEMFLPTGRTFDPRTDKGWEARGLEPDIDVPYAEALQTAIKRAS